MGEYRGRFGPHNPDVTYIPHAFPEQLADLGEVQMNYATVGEPSKPALLLIPGQTESWWGYEAAMALLAERFQCYAIDLRGQGRSTRTPGRYTLDNMGNDLVRFIDWDGVRAAAPDLLPAWMLALFTPPEHPPQNLKEYDPEWGRAFWTGTVAASCDHERMLRSAKVPVLFTHHFRQVDPETGFLMGALSDLQARRALELLAEAGVTVDYRSFETMGHSMHGQDPQLFADTVVDWAKSLMTV